MQVRWALTICIAHTRTLSEQPVGRHAVGLDANASGARTPHALRRVAWVGSLAVPSRRKIRPASRRRHADISSLRPTHMNRRGLHGPRPMMHWMTGSTEHDGERSPGTLLSDDVRSATQMTRSSHITASARFFVSWRYAMTWPASAALLRSSTGRLSRSDQKSSLAVQVMGRLEPAAATLSAVDRHPLKVM